MHELAIVRNLVEVLEKEAIVRQAKRITAIRLKFSPFSGFDADDVQFSFDIVKKEKPIMSDAILTVIIEKGIVTCNKCSNKFEVEELPNICPNCDSIDLTPLVSTDLVLESYDIEK